MKRKATTTSRGNIEVPKIGARIMLKWSRGNNNIQEECCRGVGPSRNSGTSNIEEEQE